MTKTLSEHAAYELVKAGVTNSEDPELRQVAVNTMALIKRIEKQKMNERQAQYTLQAFSMLCDFLPLSPLTNDPEEWDRFEIDRKNLATQEVEKKEVWQSKRQPSVFSEDQGKTFTDQRTGKTGELLDAKEYAAQLEKEKADRVERKQKAKERAEKPAEVDDTPAAEQPIVTTSDGAVGDAKASDETTADTSVEEPAKGNPEADKETK